MKLVKWITPALILLLGIVCGQVPNQADGVSLAGIPNVVFILLNVSLTSYAAGMIHGMHKEV